MAQNEPEDTRQYDHDPRSPYYDDGGQEAWCEQRYDELLKDISEIDCLDLEKLGELVVDFWHTEGIRRSRHQLLDALGNYIEQQANAQTDKDWENFEPFEDSPDEPRVPNDFM